MSCALEMDSKDEQARFSALKRPPALRDQGVTVDCDVGATEVANILWIFRSKRRIWNTFGYSDLRE